MWVVLSRSLLNVERHDIIIVKGLRQFCMDYLKCRVEILFICLYYVCTMYVCSMDYYYIYILLRML